MERKPYLFMTRGIPASGKSTWTRSVAQRCWDENQHQITIVSYDDLREMLHQNPGTKPFALMKDAEKMVQAVQNQIVNEALVRGMDVIVHNTHCHPGHPKNYDQTFSDIAELYIVDFKIDVAEAKARNKLCSRRVPAHVIDSMASTLEKRADQWGKLRIITPGEAEARLVLTQSDIEAMVTNLEEA